jgi:hypothetical protein
MSEFDVRVLSEEGASDYVATSESEVTEVLRTIGLEWKTADWPHHQAVVITVAPRSDPREVETLRERLERVQRELES